MKDFYQILELNHNASEADIKKAFRMLAIKYHPDKNQNDEYFSKKFIEIKEAYDILIDPEKKREFDLAYELFIQSQSSDQKQEQSQQRERQKREEKEKEERYFYEPFKAFYSTRDRDLQDTPQFNPIFDLWGEKLNLNLAFLCLPKRIGKIIGAFSDLKADEQPLTKKKRVIRIVNGIILCLIVCAAIIFLIKPSIFWTFFWSTVPVIITIWVITAKNKFKHKNFFIGVNGFAEYECRDTRENIVINREVNFNDVTDLYVYQIEKRINFNYQGTDFLYMLFNANNGNIPYSKDGTYDKKTEVKRLPIDFIFCRNIENFWTMYLLDKMEETLQRDGHLLFKLYSHESNKYQKYIKLSLGQITFIKGNTEEFTYKFNEIKRMYSKGNELHIQHNNFQRTLYFFKSGNEDVIPMLNLCNRLFFYKALELLLGYKI